MTMFGRREVNPEKILRMNGDQWRQGDVLRVTPRKRWDGDPEAKRMVIRRRDFGEVGLSPMRWGLVPETTHDGEPARPLIAVRAETIAEQIEWRRLLNAKRCVVPADQFFEWTRVGGVKTREYVFRLRSRRPMMIAGLWSRSPNPSVKPAECFAYISCPANRLIGQIHDRMPVILDDAGVTTWLNPDAPLETLIDLMKATENSVLELQAVGAAPRARPYQPSLFASRAA
ncbi:MAG: SOS response-associated peptidase family protein [Alphaproteobacteria bacterium]|jgi:putative SOS response-associated peptidase YedK|nr:SOS response-associated peptidase family protein [Alphaproteobacteria bacterium]